MPGGRYPGLQSESFLTVAGFVMASLNLDAAAHVQDPSRSARRVSVLQWGTLPLGTAPLPVRSPQRRGFSFRPAVYRCRAPINFEPQFGHLTPANALHEAMFHPITPWSLIWIASCHAKSSN